MSVLINLKNVSKHYGNFCAVKRINLNIVEGEVLCIIGPSGSGKSTLIRCINYLEEYDGRVIPLFAIDRKQLIQIFVANGHMKPEPGWKIIGIIQAE